MKFNLSDILSPLNQTEINFESVKANHNNPKARRICFKTTHKNSLKASKNPNYVGTFNVPFYNTIGPIFKDMTKLDLFPAKQFDNWWRSIRSQNEFDEIEKFIHKVRPLVFLRDTLALSISISELREESERTAIGELEYRAKYKNDDRSFEKLCKICVHSITNLPYYKETDVICAVPANKGESNLPMKIANNIDSILGIENITGSISWGNTKPPLKGLHINKKWPALEESNLIINKELIDRTVLILDDLYQSGLTLQYVASKIQKAGAKYILGITLVKSQCDTDNV